MKREIETRVDVLKETEFESEDVNHVEEALRHIHANNPGLLAMPGLEHVRNMLAARVGMDVYPEGHFAKERDSG